MLIVAIEVYNVKKIREVKYAPEADRLLVLVAGENAQGKSSLADAVKAAIGGAAALPPDPVRHGAKDAAVVVRYDNGLTVMRQIKVDGTTVLEVRDDLGAVKKPQAVLDKLRGTRFLDPLAFLEMPGKEQRAALLKLIDVDGKIALLDERRGRLADARRDVGRDMRKLAAQLDGTPQVEAGTEIDVAALVMESTQIAAEAHAMRVAQSEAVEARRVLERAGANCASAAETLARAIRAVEEAERIEEESRQVRGAAESNAIQKDDRVVEMRAAFDASTKRSEEITAQMNNAGAQNRAVAAARASNAQRDKLVAQVTAITAQHTKHEDEIATIDEQKAAALEAAKLPVPGLGVTEEAVTYQGVPLEQASSAERLRVALGMAIAAQSELRDVWISDGSLLDDTRLAQMAELAREAGVRLWVERVGDRDPGALVIAEGRVIAEPPPMTEAGQLTIGGI